MSESTVVFSLATMLFALSIFVWRLLTDARLLRKEHSSTVSELQNLRARYSAIIDLEAELTAIRTQLAGAKGDQAAFYSEDKRRRAKLNEEYEHALTTYEALKKEISLLEENMEDISFGVYKPHFTFQTSEEYKAALENLRDRERQLIRDGRAAVCATVWTVGNSPREGARMVKLNEKLLLRAFNGECDAGVANVSWNNVTTRR